MGITIYQSCWKPKHSKALIQLSLFVIGGTYAALSVEDIDKNRLGTTHQITLIALPIIYSLTFLIFRACLPLRKERVSIREALPEAYFLGFELIILTYLHMKAYSTSAKCDTQPQQNLEYRLFCTWNKPLPRIFGFFLANHLFSSIDHLEETVRNAYSFPQ